MSPPSKNELLEKETGAFRVLEEYQLQCGVDTVASEATPSKTLLSSKQHLSLYSTISMK